MKHVLRLITVAVVLLLVVFGFYEYKRSHTTRETYPGIEDLAEKEPERKVTLLPIGGGDETVTRVENATGGDKAVSNKNEGKTENKVTPQMFPTAAPTATPEPAVTPTVGPTIVPITDEPMTEKEPKATPHVLAVENRPGVQEGWGKIKSSLGASLTMKSLPLQGAGSVKKVDGQKSTAVIISSDMQLKLYGLYEGEQGKIYRHVGVTYVGNEYYGYVLADRIEECAEGDVVLPTPTATAAPTPTQTPVWRPTTAPAPTNVPVWMPTATPVPTTRPVATATPIPTATTRPVATATPRPTAGPIWVPTATPIPTATTRPIVTATPRPVATATPRPTVGPVWIPTATPVATATPMPTATLLPTPTPMPTATPIPTATPVPVLELVTAGEYDYREIPDKYNTGCSGSLTKINSACTVDGVEYSLGNNGTMLVIDWYYRNKNAADEIVIRNVDFSDLDFGIRNAASVDVKRTVRFENCKFGSVSVEVEQENAQYIFTDCSFVRFYGSNSIFERCSFGGSCYDGMTPFQNVLVTGSYFVGYPQYNEEGKHTDAMQVFGKAGIDAENIFFQNCRIEIPIIRSDRKTAINACFMVQMEYSNARNFLFENCIINGGGYSIYAHAVKGDWTMENIVFRNISIGSGHLFRDIYPDIDEKIEFDNLHDTEKLYVASVWKDSLGKVHLSVSNDTSEDRILLVVTESGVQEFYIPCKATAEAQGAMEYYDLPIDIEVVTADAASDWVVCYDGEETTENQIRFVNWSGETVYRETK